MKTLTDKLFKQKHYSYVVSLSSGVIEGGCEQVAMDIIPKALLSNDVIIWNFNRGINAAPIIQVYLRVTDRKIVDEIVDEFEEAIATELDDDFSLSLQRLVEITDSDNNQVEHPLGVRSDVLNNIENQAKFDQWQVIDHAISKAIIVLLKLVREEGLDRKTQAPYLLYSLLKNFINQDQISARSNQLVQMLLINHPKKVIIEKKFKQMVFKLFKDGVDFLDGESDLISTNENLMKYIVKITSLMKRAEKSGEIEDADLNVWKSFMNKLGFTEVETAYISSMVSIAAREKHE